jgi:Tfp pilus assembly protein PilZ
VNAHTQVLWARNLSRGGIFVQNQRPDSVGTHAHLSFTFPGGKSRLLVRAKVARATSGSHITEQEVFPPGNGLEFTEISEADARLLKEYTVSEESRIFGVEDGVDQPVRSEESVTSAYLPKVEQRLEGQGRSSSTPYHQMK